MHIVTYPHPALRHLSKPIKRVDAQLRSIVRRMLELMYEAKGVGLAANQVALPLRLLVVNPAGAPEEGEEFVFLNPVLSRPKGSEEGEEGCLSFPGMYGQVKRPKQIRVCAFNLAGEEMNQELDGLLARIVQHEFDHLDGVLFPDRMSETGRGAVQPTMEEFEMEFQSRRRLGEIPGDEEIAAQLADWERTYC